MLACMHVRAHPCMYRHTHACAVCSVRALATLPGHPQTHASSAKQPRLECICAQRALRGVLVVPPLAAVMLCPIGVLTGVLSNLNVALCGGTPGKGPALVGSWLLALSYAFTCSMSLKTLG